MFQPATPMMPPKTDGRLSPITTSIAPTWPVRGPLVGGMLTVTVTLPPCV